MQENFFNDKIQKLSFFNEQLNQFNDDFVFKIDWHPIKKGWSSFNSHHLKKSFSGKLSFYPSFINFIFFVPFLIAGIYITYEAIKNIPLLMYSQFFFGIFLIFISLIFPYILKVIVFDKRTNRFTRASILKLKKYSNLPLKSIYAIQILKYTTTSSSKGNRRKIIIFELNLVFNDHNRINLFSHNNKDAILKKSKTIASFLSIPIWNATDL